MKLTCLGTGNAFVPQRYWSSILVNDRILLDAGPSVLASIKRLALDPTRIDQIFISHFHGDHCFGLPFLLLEYQFISRTDAPLSVIGPPGIEARVQQMMELAYPGLMRRGWPRPLRFLEARPNEMQTIDGLRFTAVTMDHDVDGLPSYGYRLHLNDGALAYSGDTAMTENLFALIDGARVIILEADSAQHSAVHLGLDALRAILERISPDNLVFLTHLDTPGVDPWRNYPVIVPEDLRTYELTFTPGQQPQVTITESSDVSALQRRVLQRERQLHAVVSVTKVLQSRLDVDELSQHALITAMATVDADAGSILLHDPEKKVLVFRHVEGPSKDKITGMEIADTQGIAGEVFHSGEARISHDVSVDQAHIQDIDQAAQYHTHSMVTIPLQASTGEAVGVLQVLNKRSGLFDEDDLAVLQVLATQVAAAILNAQLYEKAQVAAMIDLLGHLSHDIKNLLTPVSLAGQTLRVMLDQFNRQMSEQLAKPSPDSAELIPVARKMLRQVTGDVEEILNILDESTQIALVRSKDIADTVKGLTAPPAYEIADLNDVVRGVLRVLRFVAVRQGVTLNEELGTPPSTLLDAKRMYNAVYNLINNAIGATPKNGQVTIRTGGDPNGVFPDGRYVFVQVEDTGCGMTPEVANMLFSGHVKSTKVGGTGLGTRVVKNVIEAHGGTLIVDSVLQHGTTITARIPIRDA